MFKDIIDFEDEPDISIAIIVARNNLNSNHAGIITKLQGETKVFHLAWHLKLEQEELRNFKASPHFSLLKWIKFTALTSDPNVAKYKVPALIKALQLVFKENSGGLSYALNFKNTQFDNNGKVIYGENEHGLTCSTFVTCFFQSFFVPLIDLESWKSRSPEDDEWRDLIVKIMGSSDVAVSHIEKIVEVPLNYRIKPEEIAVASSKNENELPADFDFCRIEGEKFNKIVA